MKKSERHAVETVWVLGDQLSRENAALAAADKHRTVVLMVESKARGQVLRYHRQKLVLIYSAMRHFAAGLERDGWQVHYIPLAEGLGFEAAARKHLDRHPGTIFRLAEPNSYFETDALRKLGRKLEVGLEFVPTKQFLCGREEFRDWAGGDRKRLLMENHYRRMRQKHGWLMTADGKPEGGQWNFDRENRRTFRDWEKSGQQPSALPAVTPDSLTREVMALVDREFPENPGRSADFWLPVTRDDALAWLKAFISERLPFFGDYEDMMAVEHRTLFHSVLSPLLNVGLLTPTECVEAGIGAWREKRAPLNAVEGFVRQIVGWREYVNGLYWLRGPEFRKRNELRAHRPLPEWFHTGETPMNCLAMVIRQLLDTGWNHHIQRLMVLGNFMLLAEIDPGECLRWFSELYVDAFDWVMVPNVIGMICHADGGEMMTKPYAASGAYIDRMSNYCEGCRFDPKIRTGAKACPFNYLYWDFYDRHSARFAANPRTSMPVRTWMKRSEPDREVVRRSAAAFLAGHVPDKA